MKYPNSGLFFPLTVVPTMDLRPITYITFSQMLLGLVRCNKTPLRSIFLYEHPKCGYESLSPPSPLLDRIFIWSCLVVPKTHLRPLMMKLVIKKLRNRSTIEASALLLSEAKNPNQKQFDFL